MHTWVTLLEYVLLTIALVGGSGMFLAALSLGRAQRSLATERIPALPDEPATMTVEKRTVIAGVTLTLGDLVQKFQSTTDEKDADGNPSYVPRARIVRVVAISGFPLLMSAADSRALAVGLEEFAKAQERGRS